jgi:hypothetical protein
VKTHPLLKPLGITALYVDEDNPVTNAPDSVCIVFSDGHALILNAIQQNEKYVGTEAVLWRDGGVVSVVSPVPAGA